MLKFLKKSNTFTTRSNTFTTRSNTFTTRSNTLTTRSNTFTTRSNTFTTALNSHTCHRLTPPVDKAHLDLKISVYGVLELIRSCFGVEAEQVLVFAYDDVCASGWMTPVVSSDVRQDVRTSLMLYLLARRLGKWLRKLLWLQKRIFGEKLEIVCERERERERERQR